MKRRVRLNKCPMGLFWYDDTLCVMTEYATMVKLKDGTPYNQRDAYIVESGEYFAGGVDSYDARGRLMVTPISYGKAARLLKVKP